MPNITDEDLQTLLETPFNYMHVYYDRVEEKVVRAFKTEDEMWGVLDEEMEEEARALNERYAGAPERYEPLHDLGSGDDFRIMSSFVAQLPAGKEREALEAALRGRKPFRNFKDTVDYTSVRLDWFEYRDAKRMAYLRRDLLARLMEDDDDFAEE